MKEILPWAFAASGFFVLTFTRRVAVSAATRIPSLLQTKLFNYENPVFSARLRMLPSESA